MTFPDNNSDVISDINYLYYLKEVPDAVFINSKLGKAIEKLSNENSLIRPYDNFSLPGGFIQLKRDLTTVLVPDLHARRGYITSLLNYRIDGNTVLENLFAGKLQIVCVGDGFHSESAGAARWKKAWNEYLGKYKVHKAMDAEMTDSISLMLMVMTLKTAFPDNFHFLKGNHENIANENSEGNRPFGKYAMEGQMVKDWFLRFLGENLLEKWRYFEKMLPVVAAGGNFVVSHSEPGGIYSVEEIINCRGNDKLIFDFTWTPNNSAPEKNTEEMLKIILNGNWRNSLYFGGHRPVSGLYNLRAGNLYVQFHNPDLYTAVILKSGQTPLPSRDIVDIGRH